MSRLRIENATLEELEDKCIEVIGTPYGHNIIGLICQEAENRFGEEEGDRLFELYQG